MRSWHKIDMKSKHLFKTSDTNGEFIIGIGKTNSSGSTFNRFQPKINIHYIIKLKGLYNIFYNHFTG